jgi:D-alanine-D-alanine ligase
MKVAILFDEIKPQDVLNDKDVLQQVGLVVDALVRLNHTYVLIPCTLDLQSVRDEILVEKPDVVFNLLDTLGSYDSLAHLPILMLDALQIPHTGPKGENLALTTRKLLVKERLRSAGLPTPHEITLSTSEYLTGKWLIKGSEEDGSFGMTDASVVTGSTEEIKVRLQQLKKDTGHTFFAEAYLDGREFSVPFLCGKTLPVVEITYEDYPVDKPRILAQAAKWQPASFEATHTGSRFDFPSEDKLLIYAMEDITKACLSLFKLNSWGRVDYRTDSNGNPFIIDINSGSCLAPDAWWAGSITKAGIKFDDAIQQVMDEAFINILNYDKNAKPCFGPWTA